MFKFLLNHFITRVIKDQRGIAPALLGIPLATGAGSAAVSALGLGGLAGMGWLFGRGKKKEQYDPLAEIRNKLMGLADEIPGLVAKRKERIGELFGEAKRTGMEGIEENIHAERGFGRTSIEDRLKTELIKKLAGGQAEAELGAEEWGLASRANILSGMSGLMPEPVEEKPSLLEGLFELGGEYLGQEFGYRRLEDILNPQKKTAGTDIGKRLGKLTSSPLKEAGGLLGY